MPLFDTDDMTTKTTGSGFQFSGVNINNLGASEYTLVKIATDRSSSVYSFASEIEGCLKTSLESCQKSPRVDNLLASVSAFNHQIEEIHGFRELSRCHLASYDGYLKPGGSTVLYDASIEAIDSMSAYGKDLIAQDYMANGIVIIITDGMDVGSVNTPKQVKEAIHRAKMSENLESILTILIGINVGEPSGEVSRYLKKYQTDAGIDQYVEAKDATPKTLARIANFISKSVSSQSQAIRSGSASQPIAF